MREITNNNVLKACLKQSLSHTCSARKGIARDVWFQLVAYQEHVSKLSVASNLPLRNTGEIVVQAHEKLLERAKGS